MSLVTEILYRVIGKLDYLYQVLTDGVKKYSESELCTNKNLTFKGR